ncbi:hypothetical protein [Aeoliella mucimassa]|uniref:Uncharacterized protein n=1 Tax=Aeoliella mucimassa TaxID=2527972 RepID=A0A518AKI1_9BACT|nr:hypothetical protein [Aeoliella mucimassa]QDU55206.1 hypothetical protein Pan181_13920 [Aeoliella mucimassa]
MIQFFSVMVVLIFMLVGWACALIALRAMFAATSDQTVKPSREFSLVDLMALFVAVLPPLLLFSSTASFPHFDWQTKLIFGGLLMLVFARAWWRAVLLLTQLRINQSVRRFAFLAIILPVILVGTVVVAGGVLTVYPALTYAKLANDGWLLTMSQIGGLGYAMQLAVHWVKLGSPEWQPASEPEARLDSATPSRAQFNQRPLL